MSLDTRSHDDPNARPAEHYPPVPRPVATPKPTVPKPTGPKPTGPKPAGPEPAPEPPVLRPAAPEPAPEPTATCANPGCGTPRPDWATARWRFCSAACKQAAYRARRKGNRRIDASSAVRALDAELQTAVAQLLDAVHDGLTRMDEQDGPRSGVAMGLRELVQQVTEVAVARDRAAGLPWAEIGGQLGVRFNTTRRRYGPRAAERLARFDGPGQDGPQPGFTAETIGSTPDGL